MNECQNSFAFHSNCELIYYATLLINRYTFTFDIYILSVHIVKHRDMFSSLTKAKYRSVLFTFRHFIFASKKHATKR